MKATELMIGDWVVNPVHKDKRKIEGVYYDKELHHFVATDGRFPQEYFDPIPLTAEILEKNGFIYRDLPFELYWEIDGIIIDCGACDLYYVNLGHNRSMDVSDVHKLQQALRLCRLKDLANNFKV